MANSRREMRRRLQVPDIRKALGALGASLWMDLTDQDVRARLTRRQRAGLAAVGIFPLAPADRPIPMN